MTAFPAGTVCEITRCDWDASAVGQRVTIVEGEICSRVLPTERAMVPFAHLPMQRVRYRCDDCGWENDQMAFPIEWLRPAEVH